MYVLFQMLWPSVTKIGCAMADCPDGLVGVDPDNPLIFTVCLYDQPWVLLFTTVLIELRSLQTIIPGS